MVKELIIKMGKNYLREIKVVKSNGEKLFTMVLYVDGTLSVISAPEVWLYEDTKVDMCFRNKVTGSWLEGEDKNLHTPNFKE